MAGLFLE